MQVGGHRRRWQQGTELGCGFREIRRADVRRVRRPLAPIVGAPTVAKIVNLLHDVGGALPSETRKARDRADAVEAVALGLS
jgi:hypothetical protein